MDDAEQDDTTLSPEELHRLKRGEELRNQGRSEMRLEAWRSAVEKLRESASLLPRSITYELLGECHLALEDPEQAILHFAAAAGLGNKQYKPRVQLARLLYSLGKQHEDHAVMHLLEALRLNPRYTAARELLDQWVASNKRAAAAVAAQEGDDA